MAWHDSKEETLTGNCCVERLRIEKGGRMPEEVLEEAPEGLADRVLEGVADKMKVCKKMTERRRQKVSGWGSSVEKIHRMMVSRHYMAGLDTLDYNAVTSYRASAAEDGYMGLASGAEDGHTGQASVDAGCNWTAGSSVTFGGPSVVGSSVVESLDAAGRSHIAAGGSL